MSANSERERYEAWLEADGRWTTIWDVWQAALSSPHTPLAVEADRNMEGAAEFTNALLWNKPIWPNAWGQDVAAAAFFLTDGGKRERWMAAPPAPAVEPVALTDAQIDAIVRKETGFDSDYSIQAMTHGEMRRVARAVLAAAQEVEFTDDPVPTYKPGPPLEWEEGGA